MEHDIPREQKATIEEQEQSLATVQLQHWPYIQDSGLADRAFQSMRLDHRLADSEVTQLVISAERREFPTTTCLSVSLIHRLHDIDDDGKIWTENFPCHVGTAFILKESKRVYPLEKEGFTADDVLLLVMMNEELEELRANYVLPNLKGDNSGIFDVRNKITDPYLSTKDQPEPS